jgi:putative spermidine/putrescine transport system permease protein
MKRQHGRVDAPVLLAITVLVTLFTVLPMLVSVTAGLTNNFSRGLASGFTSRWLEEVWSLYGATAWRSLALALACVVVGLLIGVPCAWTLARSHRAPRASSKN